MTVAQEKRGRRPTGSDAAGTWARNLCLRVGEEDAAGKWKWERSHIPALGCKATLLALCQYVDEEGKCWPSTSTLADNTDQSWDSVNRRLADLEYLGIIARAPRWRDESGIVNKDGRGRSTTAEIMLLFDVTQADIDAKLWERAIAAKDEKEQVCDTVTDPPGLDGSVADCDPNAEGMGRSGATDESQSCDPHMNPSLNQDSLQKVSQTAIATSAGQPKQEGEAKEGKQAATEPIGFGVVWEKYPGHGTMDRDRAQRAFAALSEKDRELAATTVDFYASDIAKFKRTPISCERWLKTRRFASYGANSPSASSKTFVENGSKQFDAWCNFYAVASGGDAKLPSYIAGQSSNGQAGAWLPAAWPIGGTGWLVSFDRWLFIEEGTPQFRRYVERVFEILNRAPFIQNSARHRNRVRLIAKDNARWGDREFRGLLVPLEWPPAKGDGQANRVPAVETLMTEQDEKDFANSN